MKTAICYLSCDRPELVEQSLPPLLDEARKQKFHLYIADGSVTKPGQDMIWNLGYPTATTHSNVRGGAGAAIVYALTLMLKHPEHYDVVGLCESDVVLGADWFDRCAGLFQRGLEDGLVVGAVSARCFQDRVLLQRDDYAVMHNLGAGHILFTRAAAEIVLRTFRTGWSSDNRRIFAQLAGIDIGSYWAFRLGEHYLTADWHWDAVLAAHGLASLALTPSPIEMIGQDPPLDQQGLEIVKIPVLATNPPTPKTLDLTFDVFRTRTAWVREGMFSSSVETQFYHDPNTGTWTYFPHQMHMLAGGYSGDWHLKEARGWGTFAWQSGAAVLDDPPMLTLPMFGPCNVLMSGGLSGGRVEVTDPYSGYKAAPELPPEGEQGQVLQLAIPGGMNYRNIRIAPLTAGVKFYGVQTREKQPSIPDATFHHSNLPPV